METYSSNRKVKTGTHSSFLWSREYCPVVARSGQKSRPSLCLTTVGKEGYFSLVRSRGTMGGNDAELPFWKPSNVSQSRDAVSPQLSQAQARWSHTFSGVFSWITVDNVLRVFLARIHLLAITGFPGASEFQLASFFSLDYIQQKWKPRNLPFQREIHDLRFLASFCLFFIFYPCDYAKPLEVLASV